MTIQEAQALAAALAKQIQLLLQAFESTTGTQVHSVPVEHAAGQVTARVKVQLP